MSRFTSALFCTRLPRSAPAVVFEPGDIVSIAPHPLTRYDMAVARFAETGRIHRSWAGTPPLDAQEDAAANLAYLNHQVAKEELAAAAQERFV